MCSPQSFDHPNIEINITEIPSIHIRLFIENDEANVYTDNGTRTVYKCYG